MPDFIESIMTARVETALAKEPLKRALAKMAKKNIGSLVVVEGRRPVGMLTERDVMRAVAKGAIALRRQVGRVMSSPLITASGNTPIEEALQTMLKNGIRRLPVLNEGRLVGIITERDILRWVLRVTYEPEIPAGIKEILQKPIFAKT